MIFIIGLDRTMIEQDIGIILGNKTLKAILQS